MKKLIKITFVVLASFFVIPIFIATIIAFMDGSEPMEAKAHQARQDSIMFAAMNQEQIDSVLFTRMTPEQQDSVMITQMTPEERAEWAQMEREMQMAVAQQERNERIAEKIKAQFHPYDGSHQQLEKAIKASMHNPDSYDHVSTDWGLVDTVSNTLQVKTVYRGTNMYGAVVTNYVIVKASIDDGSIIKVIEG